VAKHSDKRLRATTNNEAIADTEVTFLALPTPSTEHKSIDLSTIEASTRSVGNLLAGKE
jgi:UDPglucose 6-dehydrogenase